MSLFPGVRVIRHRVTIIIVEFLNSFSSADKLELTNPTQGKGEGVLPMKSHQFSRRKKKVNCPPKLSILTTHFDKKIHLWTAQYEQNANSVRIYG